MRQFRPAAAAPALLLGSILLGSGDLTGAQEATGQTAPTRRPSSPVLGDGPFDLDTALERIRVTVVTKGLDHPWGMVFVPNGNILVTERPGRLRVLRGGELDPEPIAGLPEIRAALIGGLLDIALHPDFPDNRYVYFSYSKPNSDDPDLSTTAVARARWDGGAGLEDLEDVFIADDWYGPRMSQEVERCCGQGPAGGSYGSRIIFDDDSFLYVTIGDRNWGERAQDPGSHLGKIVRIHDDGRVPADNPFVGDDEYKPEIYTLGHRNPLGLTIHPETRLLWSSEFGPRGGDEVNLITAGQNYGWILVTEGTHYNDEPTVLGANSVAGMTDPVLFWVPSINPGNLLFYDGDAFPRWRGQMLMAAMSRSLVRTSFDPSGNPVEEERMLTELGQRLRDVRQGPDGLLYVLTDETAGALLRIAPRN
jgi:glucose/arabinose dehydrogenase